MTDNLLHDNLLHLTVALAVIAAILVLHQVAWFGCRVGMRYADFPKRLRRSRGWARTGPVRHWLASRFPRLYRGTKARLSTRQFSGLPLTLLIAAALYLISLLTGLVEDLYEADEIAHFDAAVGTFLAPWRHPLLLAAFLWLTDLGAGAALGAVALTATGFLWADQRRDLIAPLWIAFVGAMLTTWLGKFAIGRDRPEFIDIASAISPAFPSAHATGAMAVYGYLAYAIGRDMAHARARFELAFWTALLIFAVGFSRIFLSVHHTSDVASGFIVGSFWLLVGFAIAEYRRVG